MQGALALANDNDIDDESSNSSDEESSFEEDGDIDMDQNVLGATSQPAERRSWHVNSQENV